MSSEGIRVAAHQVGGVSGCRSDRQEAGFIPLNTRVNPSKKIDFGFQLGKSKLWNFLASDKTNYITMIKSGHHLNIPEMINIFKLIFINALNYSR